MILVSGITENISSYRPWSLMINQYWKCCAHDQDPWLKALINQPSLQVAVLEALERTISVCMRCLFGRKLPALRAIPKTMLIMINSNLITRINSSIVQRLVSMVTHLPEPSTNIVIQAIWTKGPVWVHKSWHSDIEIIGYPLKYHYAAYANTFVHIWLMISIPIIIDNTIGWYYWYYTNIGWSIDGVHYVWIWFDSIFIHINSLLLVSYQYCLVTVMVETIGKLISPILSWSAMSYHGLMYQPKTTNLVDQYTDFVNMKSTNEYQHQPMV